MAITVDSSQWTGERDDAQLAVPVVWGEFADEPARDVALARLQAEGAKPDSSSAQDDAAGAAPLPPAENGGVDVPDENPEEADQRNRRQLGVGTVMAAGSMAAAGLVIASGGALLPAVAAAAAAGVGTGAVGEALAAAVTSPASGPAPMQAPATDGPVIGLRAKDDAARRQAEAMLQRLGAVRVFVQEQA